MIANKHVKPLCFTWRCKRVLIIGAILMIGSLPSCAYAIDILLGTGEDGTFSHFTGRTICRIINKHADELNCQTVPAPGDVHNLTNLQGGALDIGLIDSRMLYDAIGKKGYFEFLDISYDTLRYQVKKFGLS